LIEIYNIRYNNIMEILLDASAIDEILRECRAGPLTLFK
jgi:hypothetical protein